MSDLFRELVGRFKAAQEIVDAGWRLVPRGIVNQFNLQLRVDYRTNGTSIYVRPWTVALVFSQLTNVEIDFLIRFAAHLDQKTRDALDETALIEPKRAVEWIQSLYYNNAGATS